MLRFFGVFLLFCLVLGRLDRYFFKKNGSFCPSFVLPNWSRCPQFDTKHNESVRSILNQPFSYLTKGVQSFVFLSADQRWIIKFIRLPRYVKRRSWKGKSSNLVNLQRTLKSFQTASSFLEKETGVIYSHLQPTTVWNQTLHLIDRYHREHFLAIDDLLFAIQQYGNPFFSIFNTLEMEEAKILITKTIDLFLTLYEKGFIDRDPILERNFGIYEKEPFIIDIGQLEFCGDLPSRKQYIKEMTHSLHVHLSQGSPELLAHYFQILQNL